MVKNMAAGPTVSSATEPVYSYDPAHLPVSPTRGAIVVSFVRNLMRLEVPIFILISMSFSSSMQNLINLEMEHQMGVYSATVYSPATRGRHLFDQ